MTILVSEVLGVRGRKPGMLWGILALLLGGMLFFFLLSFSGPVGGETASGRVLSTSQSPCWAEVRYRAEGRIFQKRLAGECGLDPSKTVAVSFGREDPGDAQVAKGGSLAIILALVPLLLGGGIFFAHLGILLLGGILLYRGRGAPGDDITEKIENKAEAILADRSEDLSSKTEESLPPVFEPRDS